MSVQLDQVELRPMEAADQVVSVPSIEDALAKAGIEKAGGSCEVVTS